MKINKEPEIKAALPSAQTSSEEIEHSVNIEKAIFQLQITMLCIETHMV